MSDYDIHSCGYYCDRHACIVAQRNELRDRLFGEQWVKTYSGGKPNYTQPIEPPNLKGDDFERAFYRDWEAGKVKRVFEPEPTIDGWPLYSGLPPIKVQDEREANYKSFAQSAQVNGIPQREWHELTDNEIATIKSKYGFGVNIFSFSSAVRELETWLKERNT
jgi:hypothetical protein